MPTAYINIGSNQGDRSAAISRAVALIADAFPDSDLRTSEVVESAPWGFESDHPFLNIGAAFFTDISPDRLLTILQEIERQISDEPHRAPDGTYCDRPIDIDLIAFGSYVSDKPDLILPHPRMHLREFVLIPMIQLAPEWRHPISGLTPGQMLQSLR